MTVMKILKLGIKRAQVKRWLGFVVVATVFMVSAVTLVATLPASSPGLPLYVSYPAGLRADYASLAQAIGRFEGKQTTARVRLVSDRELDQMLFRVELDLGTGQYRLAKEDIAAGHAAINNWTLELAGGSGPLVTPPVAPAAPPVVAGGAPAVVTPQGVFLPIVLYHYTPPDFEAQLAYLEQHGYTTIDLDQALAGLHGGPLPPKPVVLTFDDGFSDQMRAFEALKSHNMKATFYIIDAGEASKWCIGAGRRYGDPLQPPGGCGDGYLNWNQVRALDHSGLITIGGHTINHRNLAALSPADQRFEIAQGKAMLEQELGHPVRHFAYPYGAYTATSIQIARDAGYVTAVTTAPGTYQPAGSDFTLRRIRDTLGLP